MTVSVRSQDSFRTDTNGPYRSLDGTLAGVPIDPSLLLCILQNQAGDYEPRDPTEEELDAWLCGEGDE
jgi:hypothetical protein